MPIPPVREQDVFFMKLFGKILATVFGFMETVSDFLLLAMMAVALFNILLRALFNYPIFGTFEVICYLSLIMAAFAMPDTERTDSNISVTIVSESLSPKNAGILKLITNLTGMVGCSVVGYRLVGLAQRKLVNGDTTADLIMPVYIFVYIIALAFFLITICFLFKVLAYFFMKCEKSVDKKDIVTPDSGN